MSPHAQSFTSSQLDYAGIKRWVAFKEIWPIFPMILKFPIFPSIRSSTWIQRRCPHSPCSTQPTRRWPAGGGLEHTHLLWYNKAYVKQAQPSTILISSTTEHVQTCYRLSVRMISSCSLKDQVVALKHHCAATFKLKLPRLASFAVPTPSFFSHEGHFFTTCKKKSFGVKTGNEMAIWL